MHAKCEDLTVEYMCPPITNIIQGFVVNIFLNELDRKATDYIKKTLFETMS